MSTNWMLSQAQIFYPLEYTYVTVAKMKNKLQNLIKWLLQYTKPSCKRINQTETHLFVDSN